MASPLNVSLCVVAATLFWTCLGIPVARHLVPGRPLSIAMAPVLGWAIFSPPALLIFLCVSFTRASVAILVGASRPSRSAFPQAFRVWSEKNSMTSSRIESDDSLSFPGR